MVKTRTVQLEDVAYVNPRLSEKIDPSTSVSFVGMADVSAERAVTEAEKIRPYGEVAKGYTAFQNGDLLVAKITPCFENGKIGQAALSHRLGFGSTEFHVVRPDPELADGRFLLHFLRSPQFRVSGEMRMTGSGGQRRVPVEYVKRAELYLPPLDEQRRIADILDKADELRVKRRQALALLATFTQSVFHTMFGDVALNDRDWEEARELADVAEVCSGITKGRKTSGQVLRTVPYMAVSNVQDMSLSLKAVKYIDATAEEIDRLRLRRDDLLLTEGGDPDKLGRGTLWTEQLPLSIHQNHVFRVRVIAKKEVHPLFLNWLVGSSRGKSYFLKSAKQTTGIASINMTQLKAFPLLVPPFRLQAEFAKRVEVIDRLKENHSAQLAELDALFAVLQHRAFRGEL